MITFASVSSYFLWRAATPLYLSTSLSCYHKDDGQNKFTCHFSLSSQDEIWTVFILYRKEENMTVVIEKRNMKNTYGRDMNWWCIKRSPKYVGLCRQAVGLVSYSTCNLTKLCKDVNCIKQSLYRWNSVWLWASNTKCVHKQRHGYLQSNVCGHSRTITNCWVRLTFFN